MKARLLLKLLPVLALMGAGTAFSEGNQHEHTLANGLRVYVIEDHRAPVVLSSLWYRAGSADEVNGKTGIAHMLEHLMFRGTPKHPDGDFSKQVNAVGGQLNAMTSQDFTMYYEYVKRDQLPLVFGLEADRMAHLSLSPKHFKQEKQVVIEERRMRVDDKPAAIAQERLQALALTNNPYHHPVIGWPTDMHHFTLKDAKEWYRAWYHPNNAYLVVVGDVTPQAVFRLADRAFGGIPKKALPIRKPRAEIQSLGLKRALIQVPAKLPAVMMAYTAPVFKPGVESWKPYALTVLSAVLASDEAARLPQRLVRERQLAGSVESGYDPYQRYLGLFQITAVPAAGKSLGQLEKAIDEEIDTLQHDTVSSRELARIKAQVIAQSVYQQDSLSHRAMNVGIPVTCGLPWQFDQQWVTHIQAVTARQVRWVAAHYLTKRRLSVVYLEPK